MIGRLGRTARRMAVTAAAVAIGIGLTATPRPAEAVSPGAAVGIGLGAFALGTVLANPYRYPGAYYGYPPPYYYPPTYYYPPYPPRSCWNPYYYRYVPC